MHSKQVLYDISVKNLTTYRCLTIFAVLSSNLPNSINRCGHIKDEQHEKKHAIENTVKEPQKHGRNVWLIKETIKLIT